MKSLYNSSISYFLLRIGVVETLIEEPVGWDKVMLSCERDPELYGFNFEFLDESAKLVFAYGDGGGDELEALYETEGSDGLAELEFGTTRSGTRDVLYTGSINLNEYNDDTKGITCAVEKTEFDSKLRTRYDVKVSLNADKDFDSNAIPILAGNNILLHSKAIVKQTTCKNIEPDYAFLDPNLVGAPYGATLVHYIQPNTAERSIDELEGVQAMPFGIFDHEPIVDSRYQYKAPEAGHLKIYFSWYSQGGPYATGPTTSFYGIDGMFQADTPYGPNNNVWNMYVWVDRGGVVTKQGLPAVDSGRQPTANTFELDVEKDDEIYIGIEVTHTQAKIGAYTDTWINTIEFKQVTRAPRSVVKAYRIFDLLNQGVLAVTGEPDRVLSDYFSTGGGRDFVITSGYALRNFDVSTEKPVQVDLNTLLSSLQAIFNIGVAFQSVNGLRYMRVERMSSLYGDGIIYRTRTAYDWSEMHDKDTTYNEVEVGYEQYATDEFNTLDDALTEQKWLLPITTYKALLSRKSKLIASPYLLEIQRREQYKENPSKSLKNDDALFIIACTDRVDYLNISYTFNAVDATVTFSKPVGMELADRFTVNVGPNTPSLGDTWSIHDYNYKAPNSYFINGPIAITTATNTGTVTIYAPNDSPNPVFAERNQAFDKIENSIDPGSSYNLRILPKRNLYQFAPLLNISLQKKSGSDAIKNTFSKNNGALTTRLDVAAPNLRLDKTRELREDADIPLPNFELATAVHTSKRMQFKAPVGYSDVVRLCKALRGEFDSLDPEHYLNFGCIVAPDRNGIEWVCVVQSLKYNFATSEATFIVSKKDRY